MTAPRPPRHRRTGRRLRELECEAHHEAGHAVVALALGIDVDLVTVECTVRDGEEEGPHMRHTATSDMLWLDRALVARVRSVPPERYALLISNLTIAWAGVVAERVLCRRAPQPFWTKRPKAGSDADLALDMARALGVRGRRRVRDFVDSFEPAARRIVVDRWREVEAVAARLLEIGTLSGPQLRAVLERVRGRGR
jgi:hypothetical protein